MTTTEQEARALELHQTRKANTARHHGQHVADLMTFDGGERDFCLRIAAENIQIEADFAAAKTAEDRWYEDQFAAMSDDDIAFEIARIDREVALLPYASLTVNIADRKRGFVDLRSRCVKEQLRRSVLSSTSLDSSTDGVDGVANLQAAE